MAAKKFLRLVNGDRVEIPGVQTSAGVTNAGDIPALDDTGRLSTTMLPVGVAPDLKPAIAFEALAAGDFVNLFTNAGVLNARKADATNPAKFANGFVLAAVLVGATGSVYGLSSINNAVAGLTPGAAYWLSNATPGGIVTPAPTYLAGQICQKIGTATAANEIWFLNAIDLTQTA